LGTTSLPSAGVTPKTKLDCINNSKNTIKSLEIAHFHPSLNTIDIAEIMQKLAFNTNQSINQSIQFDFK
jgi:hypothetical protein